MLSATQHSRAGAGICNLRRSSNHKLGVMAYDLHIVRTKNWLEASTAPVTKNDVDALIASDPELEWSTTDYVDMNDDNRAVTRYWMIAWRGQACFWWYRDEIRCSGPD